MNRNYVFPNVDDALPGLAQALITQGDEVGSRNGRVMELTHVGTTLTKPWQREILLPERKANLAAQIAETMWVLAGRNDIGFLSHYLPRAKDFSDDGKTWRAGYGPRLRDWRGVDQLAYVVDTLKADPLSRQAVISLWDPTVDTTPGLDRACNNWLSFTSRLGKLDLHVAIRSNDLIWGWSGINAFEWSVLQEIVAGLLGVQVGRLHFSTTSLHVYDKHWAKAQALANRTHYSSSDWMVEDSHRFRAPRYLDGFDNMVSSWFVVEEMIRNGYCPDGVVDEFTEPMLRSWLRVLQWWWSGDEKYLEPLKGTRLHLAARSGLQPLSYDGAKPGRETPGDGYKSFFDYAINLHNEKHAAYGDSWKRRGEMLGILANIARKVDRLGGGETSDETSADTALDLAVYLAKYRCWMDDPDNNTTASSNSLMALVDNQTKGMASVADPVAYLTDKFDLLEKAVVQEYTSTRTQLVEEMLEEAWALARRLWENNQDEYRGADHE